MAEERNCEHGRRRIKMSQHKGAKGGLGRTPPKRSPRYQDPYTPWAARRKAGSSGSRGTL